VQDNCYDAAHGRWIVDARAAGPRAVFYTGPKAVLIVLGLAGLTLAAGPQRWRDRCGLGERQTRRGLWVAFLTLATGPMLIGLGKDATNVFCPSEIRRYGGDVPYAKLFSSYPAGDRPERRGRGFPAGHASGGFALLALAGLARTRRGRWLGAGIGLTAGWTMGLYQMLKGAHYLSHTVVTMLVLWLVFLAWRRVFRLATVDSPVVAAPPEVQVESIQM
jgi:membrane-associated PAP2 superfamily phosphatase